MALDPSERKAGIAYLDGYISRIAEILVLIDHPVSPQSRELAAEKYGALKDDLKAECQRLSRAEAAGTASELESAWLLHTIHEASTELRPARNSHPINSKWGDALYSAKLDLGHTKSHLVNVARS